ncbi:MAG TPA: hypothetical protein VFB50_13625 [Chloroflexota bacterium]|nr:hypothetical protein [Chloroflexota bacterium]
MSNILPPQSLRRLQRFRGRLEGAEASLQAIQNQLRAAASEYETALRAACEDAAIDLPHEGAPAIIKVDWSSGEVSWEPAPEGLPYVVDGVAQ